MKNNRNTLLLVIAAGLAIYAVFRLLSVAKSGEFVDFRAYYDTAWAIFRGENPYILSNLRVWEWAEAPICFPGLSVLATPLLLFDVDTAKYVFLLLNFSSAILLFALVFSKSGLLPNKLSIGFILEERGILIAIAFFIFISSSPLTACLRHGQVVCIASLLLCLSIFIPRTFPATISLALTAICKYSIMTVLAPALFARGRFIVCVLGFAIFASSAFLPLAFGCDMGALYSSYLDEIRKQTSAGFNTYEFSGYNMLNADFFKFRILGTIIKVAVLCASLFLILKLRREKGWRLMDLLTLCSATMLISYHRMYDLVLLLPFMLAATLVSLERKEFTKTAVLILFSLACIVPENIVYRVSNEIASLIPAVGEIIYLSPFRDFKTTMPFYSFLTLAIFAFSFLSSIIPESGSKLRKPDIIFEQ